MKKFLSTVATLGVLATSANAGLLNFNQTSLHFLNEEFNSSKYESIYNWTDVNINHNIETNSIGTDEKSDNGFANKATAKSWSDFFMHSNLIIASGYFAFHTYTEPKFLTNAFLTLKTKESTNLIRIWEFNDTHDKWYGWGHHTSQIKLTVTAKYDEKEELTALSVTSYVYARTAGAVHSCSTSSQIDTIRFIVD